MRKAGERRNGSLHFLVIVRRHGGKEATFVNTIEQADSGGIAARTGVLARTPMRARAYQLTGSGRAPRKRSKGAAFKGSSVQREQRSSAPHNAKLWARRRKVRRGTARSPVAGERAHGQFRASFRRTRSRKRAQPRRLAGGEARGDGTVPRRLHSALARGLVAVVARRIGRHWRRACGEARAGGAVPKRPRRRTGSTPCRNGIAPRRAAPARAGPAGSGSGTTCHC